MIRRALIEGGYYAEWTELLKLVMRDPGRPRKTLVNDWQFWLSTRCKRVRIPRKDRAATHFLLKTLPKVAAEMALHVLAHNLTRVINIIGIKPLIAAIRV